MSESIDVPDENVGPVAEEQPVLERSSTILSREMLRQIFGLSLKQPWLEPRQEELLDLFDICNNKEEADLISDLLYRFNSLSHGDYLKELEAMINLMVEQYSLKPETTLIAAPEKSDFSDGAQAILWHAKSIFTTLGEWKIINFISNLKAVPNHAKDGHTIVLLEEFVGSGESASKSYKWIRAELEKRGVDAKVVCFALTCMEAGSKRLVSEGIDHYVHRWISRGISDYYKEDQLDKAVSLMERLEEELCPVSEDAGLKKVNFGYARSEALYHLEGGNAPNNVFPIFWWKWAKGKARRRTVMRRL